MKLSADHVIIKSDGHDGSFQRDMWLFFFYGKNMSTNFNQDSVIGTDCLIVPAVHYEEWILESFEYGLLLSVILQVNWEYAKGCGFSPCNICQVVLPADELE